MRLIVVCQYLYHLGLLLLVHFDPHYYSDSSEVSIVIVIALSILTFKR